MLVRGLMGCQSTAPSSLTAEQPSPSAKHSRVNTTQASPQVARSPASKKPKRKSSLAQADTTAQSRKPKQKPAQPTSGVTGSQAQTPASQPASKSAKRKPKAVQPTTAAKSRKPASKPAQTTSGKRGRPRKIPA
jgi:type II secretory pathway component HofQ